MYEMISFLPAVFLLVSSGRYISSAYLTATPFLTLSTMYLMMRFNQIDNVLNEILRADTLDKNVRLLQYFIRLHDNLCIKTLRYNAVIKWYLLVAHYTFGGVIN